MDTERIIKEARAMTQAFVDKGGQQVKVPVFDYENWRQVYQRPADGDSLSAHRQHTRRNFYLMHFLRAQGVEVAPVVVRADEFNAWAKDYEGHDEHDMSDGHGLAHAVGEYVNRPQAQISPCQHDSGMGQMLAEVGGALATITSFGEDQDQPEVLSVAVHTSGGEVLTSLELLAADMSGEQAWGKVQKYLDSITPKAVFHDRTVRRPEFCGDCNALLVNVASPQDIAAVKE